MVRAAESKAQEKREGDSQTRGQQASWRMGGWGQAGDITILSGKLESSKASLGKGSWDLGVGGSQSYQGRFRARWQRQRASSLGPALLCCGQAFEKLLTVYFLYFLCLQASVPFPQNIQLKSNLKQYGIK
jgi:hypothetical protein